MFKKGILLLSLIMLAAVVAVPVAQAEKHESEFLKEHRRFFTLLYPEGSDLQIGALWQPKNKAKNGDGEFDLLSYTGNFEIPIPLNDDFYLRFGADYEARQYDFSKVSLSKETLHKVSLSTGAGVFLADNLLLTGTARPGIYSDFEGGVDDNDVRFFGEAQLVYQINPGAQLLGGIAYNEVFDDTPLYPLFGIRLLSEEGNLFLSLTFPSDARIGFNISPETQLYLGAWISGDEYRATIDGIAGDFDLHVQDHRLGGGIRYWFTDHLGIKGELGYVYKSELDFKNPGADFFNGENDSTGFARVAFNAAF